MACRNIESGMNMQSSSVNILCISSRGSLI
jgi:hypothetical protein